MSLAGFLAAFGGGVLGSALGAVPAFVFVGFIGLIGVAVLASGGGTAILDHVAFGPIWAPSAGGFAAGVAAAAYAKTKGKLEAGNDIITPIFGTGAADAVLVGGVFGIVGYVIVYFLNQIGSPGWTDTVALGVALSAIIVRLIWGKTGVTGSCPADKNRYASLQSNPLMKIVMGLGAGLAAAYIAISVGADNGGATLIFCISAASLVFLQTGFSVPVTHQITLPAAYAAIASGSLVWGAVFGIAGAFFSDFIGCFLNEWGDTHIDPPACTIAALATVSFVFANIGIFSAIGLP